jgi:S1-C subfamily serine protease
MRKLILFVSLLFLAQAAQAQDYSPVVATLDKSVLRVEIARGEDKGSCTAVVFDVTDGRASAFTAAHCIAHEPNERLDFTVDGRSAKGVLSNRILDLGILTFRAPADVKPIELAPATPLAGKEAIVAGYAFGVEEIVFQFGHVAKPRNKETKQLWINGDIIFGDSGGAILDASGRLIGITSSIYSQGPAHIGGAVAIEQVVQFLDEYKDSLKDEKKQK